MGECELQSSETSNNKSIVNGYTIDPQKAKDVFTLLLFKAVTRSNVKILWVSFILG